MVQRPYRSADLVVAADLLPADLDRLGNHARHRERPGCWAAALRPVVDARHGTWVGWTGTPDVRTAALAIDHPWAEPVNLPDPEASDYHAYCSATLAPLYRDRVEPPTFRGRWEQGYRDVNYRFAEAIAAVAAPGGVAWVHDLHLQLVPGYLRRWRPDMLIGFVLHDPFPPAELFLQLPMRAEIVSGLLGADLIGFQHPRAVSNFLEIVEQLLGLPATGGFITTFGDRRVGVDTFPASVDFDAIEQRAADPQVRARASAIRASLHDPRTVFLAVGSLDRSEGIEQRLDAYANLLADGRLDPTRTVLVEVTTPDDVPTLRQGRPRARIDRQIARINGEHARVGHPVIHYLHQTVDRHELAALYLACDVMLATPLTAGTSLIAKEFIAARANTTGRLVLSEFTATAAELPAAITVNPHDSEALTAAMLAAATDAGRPSHAIAAMRETLRLENAEWWAGQFLACLGDCVATNTAAHVARPDSDPVLAHSRMVPTG
jgi:trehalose 6-phosphate synthase